MVQALALQGFRMETYVPPDGLRTAGSSDVPVILGLNPYADSTVWKTWAELAGLIEYRTGSETRAQRRGKRAQAMIGEEYAELTGAVLTPNRKRFVGPFPWMHAEPDFDARDPDDLPVEAMSWFTEAKSVRGPEWDELPPHVLAQAMWQRVCGPRPKVDVCAWFTFSDEFRIYPVPPEVDAERDVVLAVWRFYERHVIRGKPPPVDDKAATSRMMARVYHTITGQAVDATNDDLERLRMLSLIDERIAELDAEKTRIENGLRLAMGNAVRLVHPETKRPLASWTQESRPRVRWGDLVRDNPALADRYRTGNRPRKLNILKGGRAL